MDDKQPSLFLPTTLFLYFTLFSLSSSSGRAFLQQFLLFKVSVVKWFTKMSPNVTAIVYTDFENPLSKLQYFPTH